MEFFSREIEEPDDDLLRMFAAIGSQIGQFLKRKQAEEEATHERHLLRSLLDTDPGQRLTSRTTRAGSSASARPWPTGSAWATRPTAIGKTDFDFFTEEHARPAFEDEQEVMRTGRADRRQGGEGDLGRTARSGGC